MMVNNDAIQTLLIEDVEKLTEKIHRGFGDDLWSTLVRTQSGFGSQKQLVCKQKLVFVRITCNEE